MTIKAQSLIISLTIIVLAIILTIVAPETYSFGFCLCIFILYILFSIFFLIRTYSGQYFSFHFLFLISYLFVNFIYPVFIFPTDKTYFPVFRLDFNEDIISYATAVAFLGIVSYFSGSILVKSKIETYQTGKYLNIKSIKSIVLFLAALSFIFFILVLVTFWDGIRIGKFGSTGEENQYILALFQITFELAVIMEFINLRIQSTTKFKTFIRKFNKYLLFIGLLFSLLFFRVGDRGPVIQLTLISFTLYSLFISRINLKRFVVILIVGMFILTFISYARTSNDEYLTEDNSLTSFIERGLEKMNIRSFLDLGMDLIINNRNLYVGIDYTIENGPNFGRNMFIYLFAPFPKLPMVMARLVFNSTPTELSSGYIITVNSLGENASWGLGTNIISDIYMSFGVLGVIVFMFFLGYFIRKLETNMHNKVSVVSQIVYLIMISFSIYIPRSPYFSPLRFIIWSLLIYIFTKELIKSIRKIQKNQIS